MLREIFYILIFLIYFQLPGQNTLFYKTGTKPVHHYIEIKNDTVKVYKMGVRNSKFGQDPRIVSIDTLLRKTDIAFNGSSYTLTITDNNRALLRSNDKKMKAEIIADKRLAYMKLNEAYFLQSYFDMSRNINNKFPLNHHSFGNGYGVWNSLQQKDYDHDEFKVNTNITIRKLQDSIFEKQNKFTNTTNYIIKNAIELNYSLLKDSLKTLPIEYRSISWYFGESVYQLCKANPENYYKILEDLPGARTTVYYAVDLDKEIVEQIKHVDGHDKLKKEFIKEYKEGKNFKYKVFLPYLIMGGLIAWLIIAQP